MTDTLQSKANLEAQNQIQDEKTATLSQLILNGIGPAKNIQLDFAPRANLLTGDNGLGKSFILETAWWALSGNWTNFQAYPREEQGQPVVPSLLLYAKVDGAFAIWDPTSDHPASHRPQTLLLTRDEVWSGLSVMAEGRTSYISNGLITDWINWQNSPNQEPFETLKRVLLRLSPPDLEFGDLGSLEPGTPRRIPGDSRLIPTIKHPYGEVPLIYASAGVRRIVALAYLIVWAWQEHKTRAALQRQEPRQRMVILIDEIESHLHPQWQRTILPALLDVWQDLNGDVEMQLLIATHSPLVMASLEPSFDPERDKIFHIDLVQNGASGPEVCVKSPEFVVYGTVDSWLRSEVFELGQARSMEAEKAIEDAKQLQFQGRVSQRSIKNRSSQSQSP